VIPLRDDNPTRHIAFVTIAIVALNVLVFLVWQPTFGSEQEQDLFFFCHAEIPWEISHQTTLGEGGPEAAKAIAEQFGESLPQAEAFQSELARDCAGKVWWHSLFVAMFLHANWLHIGGNMLFLWVFGNNVEDKLRPILFLVFYLAAGLVASAAQLAVAVDSVVPNLGASGAIAGVLGAYLVMFPRRRVLTLVIFFFITVVSLPAVVVLGFWFVLQVISGLLELGQRVGVGSGVAFWAHIGGFGFGAILALLFFPKERLGVRPPPRRPDVDRARSGWRRLRPGGQRTPPTGQGRPDLGSPGGPGSWDVPGSLGWPGSPGRPDADDPWSLPPGTGQG
jgi:membrane associated rhomboid family serine protease